MPITVNLRHLEEKSLHLKGEVDVKEFEFQPLDELIHPNEPLRYDLEVEQNGPNLLVQGKLGMTLDCECARCLRPFRYTVELDPYQALVPLEGEDKAETVNDVVDLTPYVREDTFLAFPQHPLCEAECDRLPSTILGKQSDTSVQGDKSAWDELNKLKF